MRCTTAYTARRHASGVSARILRILPRPVAILTLVSGDELDRYIGAQRERFTEELRELCAIACEASDRAALDAAARWCRDRLRGAGFADARELRTDGAPALVVGETGSGKRTLVGVQHYDVQPAVPLDLWKTPPYQPAIRDGAMYARGVDDNKGHLLLRIQAIEAHRDVFGGLPIRVRFLIEGEEESGSPNLARLLALEPALTDADAALKEGGALDSEGRPILSLGGKGILYCHFRVRTMSRDAHSGGATHYPNAAWRLAHAFASLMDTKGRVQIDGFYDDVRKPSDADRALLERMPFDAQATREVVGVDAFAFGRDDHEAKRASVFEPTCNILRHRVRVQRPRFQDDHPGRGDGKDRFPFGARSGPREDRDFATRTSRPARLPRCRVQRRRGRTSLPRPDRCAARNRGRRRRGGGVRTTTGPGSVERRNVADVGRLQREADGERDPGHGSPRRRRARPQRAHLPGQLLARSARYDTPVFGVRDRALT
jgi:acetylornithine deacetylase/succinyl-diaminopimelate desuccinylase-like protein